MLTKHRLGKRPLGYALLYGQKMSSNFGKLFFERYFFGAQGLLLRKFLIKSYTTNVVRQHLS